MIKHIFYITLPQFEHFNYPQDYQYYTPFCVIIFLVFKMNFQSVLTDFWKKNPAQIAEAHPRQISHEYESPSRNYTQYGARPRHQTPDSSHPPHHTQKSKARPEHQTQKTPIR